MSTKFIKIGDVLESPAIALGCMRMSGMTAENAGRLLQTAIASGINFFDHADIYGGGESESVFAKGVKWAGIPRDTMIVQAKCGIGKGKYDFSKDHIITALEGSLKRLGMDYTDTLLLHRPDTLMEPEEVAEAFTQLHKSGKVKYFGVSNQNPGQIKLLQKYMGQSIIINQLQFSLMHTGMIDAGINVNMKTPPSVDHDGGLLEFCRLENITIQAWSPFQYGFFNGVFIDNEKFPELNKQLDKMAEKYKVDKSAIAIAWILRHPAKIQAIVGTTKPERVEQISAAYDVAMTREEWYALYLSAGNVLP